MRRDVSKPQSHASRRKPVTDSRCVTLFVRVKRRRKKQITFRPLLHPAQQRLHFRQDRHPRRYAALLTFDVDHLLRPINRFPFQRQRLANPQPAVSQKANHIRRAMFIPRPQRVFNLFQTGGRRRNFAAMPDVTRHAVTSSARQRIGFENPASYDEVKYICQNRQLQIHAPRSRTHPFQLHPICVGSRKKSAACSPVAVAVLIRQRDYRGLFAPEMFPQWPQASLLTLNGCRTFCPPLPSSHPVGNVGFNQFAYRHPRAMQHDALIGSMHRWRA